MWDDMPPEVVRLGTRRGMLRPLGLVSYAEADSRIYTELISNIVTRERVSELPAGTAVSPLTFWLLSRLRDHLDGWYGLPEAARFVSDALILLRESDGTKALACLEELALYMTRLNLWIDLLIPWNELNETMLAKGLVDRT
jgi:hypothetical protein